MVRAIGRRLGVGDHDIIERHITEEIDGQLILTENNELVATSGLKDIYIPATVLNYDGGGTASLTEYTSEGMVVKQVDNDTGSDISGTFTAYLILPSHSGELNSIIFTVIKAGDITDFEFTLYDSVDTVGDSKSADGTGTKNIMPANDNEIELNSYDPTDTYGLYSKLFLEFSITDLLDGGFAGIGHILASYTRE